MREQGTLVAPVRVVPASSLAPALRAEADTVLVGNRSCSLDNMTTTCFAAEFCAHADGDAARAHFVDGNSFDAGAVAALVATSARADAAPSADVERFVGCVCVGRASMFAPAFPPELRSQIPTAYAVYNLCVSASFRGGGVGRQLLRAARSAVDADAPLYLCVLRAGLASRNAQVARAMGERVGRLEDTYARLGCERVHASERYVLFRVS